jgi:Flp pilus assembly protein TadG
MTQFRRLLRDERGAEAIEFALAVPVLITMIWGIFQIGMLYEANAGMQHALGEGARMATLCTNMTATGCSAPNNATIKAKMQAKLFGPGKGTFTVLDPVNGAGFKTLTVRYSTPMDFLVFPGPTITIERTKKAYVVV